MATRKEGHSEELTKRDDDRIQRLLEPTPSPSEIDTDGVSEFPSICKAEPSARDVFVFWEKTRFVYNSILLVSTFYIVVPLLEGLIGEPVELMRSEIWTVPILWNICYCVGPILEGYLCVTGLSRRIARWSILSVGILSMLLITAVIVKDPDIRVFSL